MGRARAAPAAGSLPQEAISVTASPSRMMKNGHVGKGREVSSSSTRGAPMAGLSRPGCASSPMRPGRWTAPRRSCRLPAAAGVPPCLSCSPTARTDRTCCSSGAARACGCTRVRRPSPAGSSTPRTRGRWLRRCGKRRRKRVSTRVTSMLSPPCPSCSSRRPDSWLLRCLPGGDGPARWPRLIRGEVAAVERISVSELADPAGRLMLHRPSGIILPAFRVRGMLIWGVTAELVDRLLALAGWERQWDARVVEPS